MHRPTLIFPPIESLAQGLRHIFNSTESADVTVIGRRANPQVSSLASEFVSCRLSDGREIELFCKYSGRDFDSRHGHRGGARYEAEIYRQFLQPLSVPSPRYFGSWDAPASASDALSCLVLQALDPGARLNKQPAPETLLVKVAAEIGSFHAAAARACAGGWPSFLLKYDADYYHGWIRRTALYSESRLARFPWLPQLYEWARTAMETLPAAPQTIIHGELYPKNVLCRDDVIYVLDWQSGAVAPGEIDLAMLAEGWPADTAARCVQAYRATRWPSGAPADFADVLAAAQLHLTFRWLGDKPEWTAGPASDWRFAHLRAVGERLGLTGREV